MSEQNEIVVVELDMSTRLRIYGQITSRMEAFGFNPVDFSELDLGFEIPGGWPVDRDAEPTLAQLVVLANKLKMRITIAGPRFCLGVLFVVNPGRYSGN